VPVRTGPIYVAFIARNPQRIFPRSACQAQHAGERSFMLGNREVGRLVSQHPGTAARHTKSKAGLLLSAGMAARHTKSKAGPLLSVGRREKVSDGGAKTWRSWMMARIRPSSRGRAFGASCTCACSFSCGVSSQRLRRTYREDHRYFR
jgi:hypothetical protein